jgi:hypothetical protein
MRIATATTATRAAYRTAGQITVVATRSLIPPPCRSRSDRLRSLVTASPGPRHTRDPMLDAKTIAW